MQPLWKALKTKSRIVQKSTGQEWIYAQEWDYWIPLLGIYPDKTQKHMYPYVHGSIIHNS